MQQSSIMHRNIMVILWMAVSLFFLMIFPVSAAPNLTKVAESSSQWTGIAISRDGRIFVNYPTWNDYPKGYRVAELVHGVARPYPNEAVNKEFVCVQSIITDDKNHLWILDPAKLKGQDVAPTGARLYEVDLNTDELCRVYVFSSSVALPQSYLNDVRIDTKRQMAYVTDSGLGGIIVLDLKTGNSWRALSDIPEVKANLTGIDFVSTGRFTHVSQSDGIELSGDGRRLYFTALGGTILYSISTDVLQDTSRTIADRQKHIIVVNPHNVATDGMLLKGDCLYMADLAKEKIWEYDLKTGIGRDLALPEPVRWADSFASAPDGSIYFTTSEINYAKAERQPYGLYKLTLDTKKE